MKKIRLAIQKSGRLSDKSLQLLKEAGISITNGNRKLLSGSSDFPLEILYLRDDDIPAIVNDGVADLGIIGENEFLEKGFDLPVRKRLGFARCKLSLAINKEVNYTGLEYFQNKKIATSYKNILAKFLQENSIQAEIHEINGSVEICPSLGLSDAIFDIVSTGSTLISNGLKEVEKVMNSEALLISSREITPEKEDVIRRLIFRIESVQRAERNKYIVLNAPDENLDAIISMIPGIESPTIAPLNRPGWKAVHSLVNENDFWPIIDKIKLLGANGILVMPIEKIII